MLIGKNILEVSHTLLQVFECLKIFTTKFIVTIIVMGHQTIQNELQIEVKGAKMEGEK